MTPIIYETEQDALTWATNCDRLGGGYVLPVELKTVQGYGAQWFVHAVCSPFETLERDANGNAIGVDAYPRALIPLDVARAIGIDVGPVAPSAAGMDMGRPPQQPPREPEPSFFAELPGWFTDTAGTVADVLAPDAPSDSAERRRGAPELDTTKINPLALAALGGIAFFALRRRR